VSALRLLYTTWPDVESARRAAHTLVDEQLVACANLIPGMESIYRWQGAVESATEVILLLKTLDQRVAAVMQRVAELHTYSVPCVVELSVGAVAPAYLAWAVESVRAD
jgi:periplasmic divalent cation tolerance protein